MISLKAAFPVVLGYVQGGAVTDFDLENLKSYIYHPGILPFHMENHYLSEGRSVKFKVNPNQAPRLDVQP